MRARAATLDDLPRLLDEEARARAARHVLGWPQPRHRAALADDAIAYRVYEDAAGWQGFVILETRAAHRSVELVRIVAAAPGRGTGRAMLRDTLHHVFAVQGANRLWLTSFADNARAHRVYRHLGFVQEGVLRQGARRADGFQDVIVFAILAREWQHTPLQETA